MTRSELEELYLAYGARLIAYARNLAPTEQDAEDVVQAVFVSMARHGEKKKAPRNPRSYLFAACRNEAISLRRKRRRDWEQAHLETGGEIALEPREPSSAELAEMRGIVAEALRVLPEEQREVLHLKIFEGMSFLEIAGVLNVPMHTAASRYRYALSKMSRKLKPWKDKI